MFSFVVFCSASKVYQNNQILKKSIAKKYPGSLWVIELSKYCRSINIKVLTSDIALQKIKNKKILASEILVIQEEIVSDGKKLIELGAIPFLIFSLESPLYSVKFYNDCITNKNSFNNKFLFKGVIDIIPYNKNNQIIYFPSHDKYEKKKITKWSERKLIVFVAANKYYIVKKSLPRKILNLCEKYLFILKNNNYKEFSSQELHDKRLEYIEFFGKRSLMDLYGRGWNNISNLPIHWQKRLRDILINLKPTEIQDKYNLIKNYKFSLCIENISFPGYITEKIIDSLKSGVIPLYLGASDISFFIPSNCFIDLRSFDNFDNLIKFLNNFSEKEALEMIRNGQLFLKNSSGLKFSYQSFAENIFKKIKCYVKN